MRPGRLKGVTWGWGVIVAVGTWGCGVTVAVGGLARDFTQSDAALPLFLSRTYSLSTMNECHYDKRMDFFYNMSNTDTADEWTGTKLVIVLCVGTFFCLFIFFSNSLVIAAVITNRKFHFPFYYLLANLAAADFFAGIAYVFLMFNTGPVSKTLTVNRWFLRQGLLDTSLTASLANLLVIAVERHMSIMRMRIHSNLTKKRVTLLILLVWAIAIFMGAVPTLGWNCLCNISACSSLAPIYSRSYLIFWTVSNLLAFFIMVVVYVRIYMYVKRKTNVLSPHTSGSISRRRAPMKLMKTVMTVLGKQSQVSQCSHECSKSRDGQQMPTVCQALTVQ